MRLIDATRLVQLALLERDKIPLNIWRCWASRPTDEEREAAAWES